MKRIFLDIDKAQKLSELTGKFEEKELPQVDRWRVA